MREAQAVAGPFCKSLSSINDCFRRDTRRTLGAERFSQIRRVETCPALGRHRTLVPILLALCDELAGHFLAEEFLIPLRRVGPGDKLLSTPESSSSGTLQSDERREQRAKGVASAGSGEHRDRRAQGAEGVWQAETKEPSGERRERVLL